MCLTVDFEETIFYIFFLNVGFLVFSNFFPRQDEAECNWYYCRFLDPILEIYFKVQTQGMIDYLLDGNLSD